MATIDELTVEVQSKAKDANNGIDALAKGLEKLAGVVEKIQSGKLKSIGRGIEQLSNGMKGLKDVKLPNYTTLSEGLGKFTEVDSEKLKTVSDALNPLANSIQTLSGANFDGKNIQGFVNSITRLSNANTESLKNINFTALGDSIKGLAGTLSGAEKVQQNTISMTNAIAKLANAGEKANVVKDTLPGLGVSLKDFMNTMSSAPKAETETIQFTQAIGTLANAGKKAETTAGNLGKLGQETLKLIQSLSDAPRVSSNTISLVQAISQLANAGGRAGISSNNLSGNLGKLSKSMFGVRGSTIKAVTSLKSFATQIAASMGVYLGIYGAIRGLKKAVDLSSDLTEVQNVVNVTFGNMTNKVEEFAQTSIKTFGMSELATKQFSSQFQAMGTAMGINPSLIGNANKFLSEQTNGYVGMSDSMSDVSLNLTKLTADMASFYNVEQAAVAEDLAAIFTGQTRPLRTYGLDLTQATLAEWALKHGMDADIKSMSQAEKTMLRYQYVLANTTASHGDFAKTAGTWANQVRILSQQFQQFGSIVGKGVIAAFKPFIQTLNKVMAKVITFSENVLNALGKIFGWKFEITGGGLTGDLGDTAGYTDDIASGAGDASDGYKDAAKNAKKLKDVVLGIDELNINAPADDTGSAGGSSEKPSGSGGSGAGAGAGGLTTNMFASDTILKAYESNIDSLYELGEYVGETLTRAMNSIRWGDVYESARNFGKGLADFLNGLISPDLFGAVGRTIAGSLNTAVYAALTFGETFNWKEFGLSIATGVNEFFKTFDFSSVARAINTWVNGIFDTIFTTVDNTDWGLIGRKIGTFIAEIDILKAIGKLGKAVWKAINAAIKTYAGTFSKAPVETALLSLMVIPKALRAIIDTKFIQGIATLAKKFQKFGGAAKLAFQVFTGSGGNAAVFALSESFPRLSKAVDVSREAFLNFKQGVANGNIFTGLNAGISTIRDNLTKMQKGVIGAVGVFAEFGLVKDAFYDIAKSSEVTLEALAKVAVGAGVAVAALKLIGVPTPWTAAIAGITLVVGALVGFKQAVEEVNAERIGNSIADSLTNPGGMSLNELIENTNSSLRTIGEEFDNVSEHVSNFEKSKESIQNVLVEIDRIETSMNSGAISTEEGVERLKNAYQDLVDAAKIRFQEYETLVFTAFADGSETSKAFEAAGFAVDKYKEHVTGFSTEAQSKIEELSNEIANYAATDPTNPRLPQAKDELAGMLGVTDGVTAAISELDTYIAGNPLDWSSYINEGTLDPELVITDLTSLTTAVEETQSKASEAMQELANSAKEAGDEEYYQGLKTALPDAIGISSLEAAKMAKEQTDIIQNDLIGGINKQIETAQKQWEEMKPWEKAAFKFEKGNYINEAISSYKSNYIDPLSEQIETGLSQLGIDGAGWAGTSAETIIDSLFDKSVSYSKGKKPVTVYELKSDWEGIIDESMKDLPNISEQYANDTIEGYNKGIHNSFGSVVTPITEWMTEVYDSIHDSDMRFGSPSLTAMQFGKDTIDGYNKGIDENTSSTKGFIDSMMKSVIGWMSEGLSPIKTSLPQMMSSVWEGIKNVFAPTKEFFSKTFGNAYEAVKAAFSFANTWFDEKWSAVKSVFSPTVQFFSATFTNGYNAVKAAFSFINTWFQDKWNAVKNVFRDVKQFFKEKFEMGYNAVKAAFNAINTWFSDKWGMVKGVFRDVKSFFSDAFQNAYNAVTRIWDGIGGYFKRIANNIISPIGKAVNGVINGINWVLEKVGSNTRLKTWDVPTFATGTNGLPRDTIGVVNDQAGSTYKELIVPPSGKPFIPEGRNVVLPMEKGTKIMPAKQTKAFMEGSGMPHFAGGIGNFLSGAWEAVKSFTGNVMDYLTKPREILKVALDKFVDISGWAGIYGDIASGAVNKVFDSAVSYIKGIFDTVVPHVNYTPSAGVEQWRQLASHALKLTNQFTEANVNALLMQMQHESGGNPNAINNWDINAKRGTPSKGLMQVIDPTFRAYALAPYNTNIYDPLSNMIASIRYTVSRYGSLYNGWTARGYKGYASGIGKIKVDDLFPKYEVGGFPEDGLFMANHDEIVGRFSNGRTAVANDYQIEKGVEEATYRGYMRAHAETRETALLEEIRDAIREGRSISIDGREIVRAYDSRKARNGFSFT